MEVQKLHQREQETMGGGGGGTVALIAKKMELDQATWREEDERRRT